MTARGDNVRLYVISRCLVDTIVQCKDNNVMSNQLKVFLSSLKMAIATFCSRVLGLVREQVLAYLFGASGLTDAFLVAYRIPNLLRDLFAEGAFSAAFVPTFVEVNGRSKEEARKLFWALFILLGSLTLFFGVLIFIFAPEIINLFAPTFQADIEKYKLTVLLTRIMSPFLCFVSLAALFMGILNSLKVFFIPSFAPVFFNIAMIGSMLIFPAIFIDRGINPIVSLAVGVFIGGILQALVQFPLVIKHGFAPINPGKLLTKDSKKVFIKLGPGLIGFAATQINLLVNTILASGTIIGAVSYLSYSFRLFQLPVGILSVSIGNSNLVHFSRAWKRGNKDQAREYLASSYYLSLFIVLPAMCALITLSEEMVSIVFQRGKFTGESTVLTANALRFYALGLPFYSIYKILVPTFYAIDKQKIPVYCSIFSIGVNVIFCVYMTPIYGFEVLALGTTISMLLNIFLQVFFLRSAVGTQWSTFVNKKNNKLLYAAMFSMYFTVYLKNQFQFFELDFIMRCTALGGLCLFVAVSYFGFCAIMGERQLAVKFLNRILKRK